MKKIKLNESDLLKIVKRVLKEQDERQFDEDEIDLLHFIFERELKPPFRKGDKDKDGDYPYYNRDGKCVGHFLNSNKYFSIGGLFWTYIKYKVCQVFGFPLNTIDWWNAIEPHLKSWMEGQLNTKIRYMS